MRKYRTVEVSESTLEDLVRQAPELIEEGLEYVDHQTFTAGGRLDVLLVDSGRALAVAELKVVEDDAMLVQGVDYYDYVHTNLEGFARAYRAHKIDPEQAPRLILIAPSFSVKLLNRIKWLDLPISLFMVKCIEFEDDEGELCPIFTEVTPPHVTARPQSYSLEDQYDYITDGEVRNLARQVVEEIQQWDPKRVHVEAVKSAISIKIYGRVIAYLEPRRKHFLVSMTDAEGQTKGYPVDGESDLETVLPLVKANFERLTEGVQA